MDLFKRYILPRLIQWLVVIFIGVTIVFIVPRLSPLDPVQTTLNKLSGVGMTDPQAANRLKEVLIDLYGLEGGLFEQYVAFWARIIRGDLGPSLTMFPTPVIEIIKNSLPWTLGLMIISIIIGWFLGMILGTLTTYFSDSKLMNVLDTLIVSIYPVPPYLKAFLILLLLAYVFPIFPLMGGAGIGFSPSFSFKFISSLFFHGFLPALTLIIMYMGFRFITQKALTSTIVSSDYVTYAEAAAVPQWKIIVNYLFRNSLLPQITDLALTIGQAFCGTLIIEIVFSYPGIGQVLYTAILQADFNLIIGITLFSIVGIATGALIIDLIYPLIDPRVKYTE